MHGDKDWRTHADEGGQGEGDGNAHSEEDEEGVADEQVAKRTRDDAELHGEREEGEVDAHEPDTKRARMGDVTAVAPPAPRTACTPICPSCPRAFLMVSAPELEAMLHAYYYAGYYAGFYDAQAGGRNEGH